MGAASCAECGQKAVEEIPIEKDAAAEAEEKRQAEFLRQQQLDLAAREAAKAAEEKRLKDAAEAEAAEREQAEKEAKAAEAAKLAEEKAKAEAIERRRAEWKAEIEKTRQELRDAVMGHGNQIVRKHPNRYGDGSQLPEYRPADHVPILALINPSSGAKAGHDILQVALRSDCYKNRFFNIIKVVTGQKRGGAMDVFRIALLEAVEEARQRGTRCRLISAGGDGTASFAMFVVFKALEANSEREEDGLKDSGNGFIWTDAEFEAKFPAFAQMPLGSANDCANILGWGQVFPGSGFCNCGNSAKATALNRWIDAVLDKRSQVVNFDVWGIMPPVGQESTNFKICELTGNRGISPRVKKDGKMQLDMRTTGNPVPLFVCLYCSVGFFGYVVARFQLNRHGGPLQNTLEYVRQGASIILFERIPPQLKNHLDGITIDCGGEPYFPPRRTAKSSSYRECGFYNINWQAHRFHGADRAPCCSRVFCCGAKRAPVKFDDGLIDLQRQKLLTLAKNPGFKMQTDKKKDFHLRFDGGEGKGFFFQFDGEARFAFRPDGGPFDLYIRQVLKLPVVIGPWHNKKLTGELTPCTKFEFYGDTPEEVLQVKQRIVKNLDGGLEKEMCATANELQQARLIQTPI